MQEMLAVLGGSLHRRMVTRSGGSAFVFWSRVDYEGARRPIPREKEEKR